MQAPLPATTEPLTEATMKLFDTFPFRKQVRDSIDDWWSFEMVIPFRIANIFVYTVTFFPHPERKTGSATHGGTTEMNMTTWSDTNA